MEEVAVSYPKAFVGVPASKGSHLYQESVVKNAVSSRSLLPVPG